MNNKIKNLLLNIFVTVVTVFLILIIAEIACIFFYDESDNYDQYAEKIISNMNKEEGSLSYYIDPDDGLRYSLLNNQLDDNYKLFSDKVSKKKKDKKIRIAVIGDSFTGGGGLPDLGDDENTYFRQLSRILNSESSSTYEVLAFADGGLNTDQELVLLKDMAIEYDPDLVILQYCDNDISPPRSELGFNDSGYYIRSKSKLLFLNGHIVPELPLLSSETNKSLLKISALARFVSYKLNIILEENTVFNNDTSASFASLEKMKNLLDEKNVPFVLINFPLAYEEYNYCDYVDNSYGGKELHDKLRQFATDRSITFLNMCDLVDDIRDIKSKNFDSGSCHYGEEGYGMAAGLLADTIKESLEE